MTNRELLELAALAAGYETTLYTGHVYIHDGTATRQWNPLENDGDAFRLMVKLMMCVQVYDMHDMHVIEINGSPGCSIGLDKQYLHCYSFGASHEENMRLAITGFAAEIGRRMNEQQ